MRNQYKIISLICCFFFTITVLVSFPFKVFATELNFQEQMEERKSLPIQSNQITGWPAGPEIGAEAAILMEVNTGTILYAKNIHEKLYPASTTKIMTCLLAMEEGNLDDQVSFSYDAVFSVPRDGSNIGMDVGQSITLEQCLYGIMVGSANECANAAAEYVSGDIASFVDFMNVRAKELGCLNTHFMNTNGLYDDNHYTTAYDLAMISRPFFQNEMLCKIGNTTRYHFQPTATQPDEFYIKNKHKLITGEYPYEGILGGKTGYTSEARETLVTCAEQNGMKLVCVILKEESPYQFTDTETLFNYGFSNFHISNIAEYETKYTINNDNFFQIGNDIFGSSKPLLSLDQNSSVILPNNIEFDSLTSEISYDEVDSSLNQIATVTYFYHDVNVGNSKILLSNENSSYFKFNETNHHQIADSSIGITNGNEPGIIFINVEWFLLLIIIIAISLITINCIVNFFKDYHFSGTKRAIKKRRKKIHFSQDYK